VCVCVGVCVLLKCRVIDGISVMVRAGAAVCV